MMSCLERFLGKQLKKRNLFIVGIGLVAIIVISSLVIYENSALNPAGSSIQWQRPIENFATALSDNKAKCSRWIFREM